MVQGIVLMGDDTAIAVDGVGVDLAKMTLKEARLSKLLSANELAKKAGTYASTVIDIEEKGAQPRMATIRRLSKALEMDPRDIAWPGDPFELDDGDE